MGARYRFFLGMLLLLMSSAWIPLFGCGDDSVGGDDDSPSDTDGDGFLSPDDCDDANPAIYPGAAETCDGLDDDCDGEIDNETGYQYYLDGDGDEFGDPEISVQACSPPDGYVQNDLDCNDDDPEVNPNAKEVCNDQDDDCDGSRDEGFDRDDDRYTTCEGDCDDTDATIHPRATEVCDGVDNNCDGNLGSTGMSEGDRDGDGVIDCADCSPDEGAAYAGAEEICDGVDNDCNGEVDEGVAYTWCPDEDGDGFGDEEAVSLECGVSDGGEALVCTDCDDTDPEVNPLAEELCNGLDDDCDGTLGGIELDTDGDGYTGCDGDCNDNASDAFPGGEEVCDDGIDQDCSGEDLYCPDQDNDGDTYSEDQGDCDDSDPERYPGADDTCDDGIDTNCDGAPEAELGTGDLEPNDDLESAIDLGTLDGEDGATTCKTMEGILSTEDDSDYYRFYSIDQFDDDWSISAVLTVPENATYCVEIFDETGAQFLEPVCATGPGDAINQEDFVLYVATGDYYAHIYASSATTCESYSLRTCAY